MGFYARKSLKAGPFRVNLSKSGIGMSVGVPGFRVGTGPRGNYVHMGRNGVSYRSTSPRGASGRPPRDAQVPARAPRPAWLPPGAELDPSGVLLHDVTGATTLELSQSSHSEVLQQLQEAARRRPLWGWALALVVILGASVPPLLLLGAPAVWWLRQRDIARRSVIVFYDINHAAADRFAAVADAFTAAQAAQRVWQRNAAGKVTTTYQHKVSGGASELVSRSVATLTRGGPKHLVTNIDVPTLSARGRTVSFLPDRVLVQAGRSYAEAAWSELTIDQGEERFIEDGRIPGDAPVVGSTWKYVNVRGGPDRRYKDNRQLPIMGYGALTLTSPQGFRAEWLFSSPASAALLGTALAQMRTQATLPPPAPEP